MLAPSEGEIQVDGRSTRHWDAIRLRRSIGYVIQEVGLFPHFTVARNIGLVPQIEGWPADRIQQPGPGTPATRRPRARSWPRATPANFPADSARRVGVARALAADPPILLMDEPFGALDPITRAELQREFLALQQRLEKTVVFVTHDLREALLLGTRIALMEAGHLVTVHTPDEFVHSTNPYGRRYVDAFDSDFQSAAESEAVP